MKNKFGNLTAYFGLAILLQLSFLSLGQIVHTENFDATNTNFLPTGWSAIGTAANFTVSNSMGAGITASPYSGTKILRMRSGTSSPTTEAVSTPSFSLQGLASNIATVSFWIYRDSLLPTNYDSLNVMINTQQSLTGAQSLGLIARSRTINLPDTKNLNGWYQYSFNIPASYTSATNYLIFKSTIYGTNTSRRICIDDVTWTEYPPACTGTPTAGAISSPDTLICGGGGVVHLTLNGATTGTGINYAWSYSNATSGPWTSFGTNSQTATSDSIFATTYFKCTVTCLGSASSTTDNIMAIVSPNAPIISITSSADTICFGDSVTMVGSGASTYTWQNNFGQILSSGASYTVTPTQATTYTYNLVGTDAIGCKATASKIIRVGRIPTINNILNSNPTVCTGSSSNLTVSATAGGGFGVTLSYHWAPDNQTTSSITVTPTDSTMYYVTVFGQYGCFNIDSTYVTINPLLTGPTVSLNQSTIDFCQGAVTLPIVVVASSSVNGSTFIWKNANGNTVSTNETLTINTLNQSTTYFVSVTDPVNGCTSSASSVLSIHAYANAAFTNVIGTGYGVTFTNISTNATSYTWNFGDGSATSNTQNPSHTYAAAGSYTVTLIAANINGCNDTVSQTLLVSSQFDPPIGGNVTASLTMICGGSGITNLSLNNASTGNGFSYAWYAGSSQAGTYATIGETTMNITTDTLIENTYFYCVVTNTNGSTNSDTILIQVNQSPLPVVSILSALDTICRNDTLNLSAEGANSYLWSTTTNQNYSTLTSIDVVPQNTTTYTLVGTQTNGCVSLPVSKTIVVGRRPTINSITSSNDTICQEGSAALNVSAFTGAAGVQLTYLWTPTASTSQSVVVSPSETTLYTVTVYGQYGCFRNDTIQVVVNPSLVGPSVSVNTPSVSFCQGASAPVLLIATSSLAGAAFTWTNANGNTVSTIDSLTINNLFQTTTYVVSVTDPSNGCTSSASSVLSIQPNATASFTNVSGDNYDVTFTNTSTNATSYAWNFGDGATSNDQNPLHTYPGSASYTITLIASNTNGCNDTISQTIIVTSPLDPPIGGSVTSSAAVICGGSGIANLTLSNSSTGNGISYTWYASTNGSGTSYTSFGNNSTMVTSNTLTQTTYFYCTVTNSNGSTNSDTILVAVNTNSLPIVSITSLSDTICSNDTITLTANGASTYLWSTGNNPNLSTQPSVSISPNNMTTYTLVGTDNSGCSSLPVSKTIVVGTNPTITNVSNSLATICSGGSSTLSVTAFAGGGAQLTYDWTTGESTQSITVSPSITTLYTITVSGLYGCSSSDTTTVIVNTGQVGPTVTLNQPTIELCQGVASQITVVATSSVSGSTFTWINANGNSISINDTLTINAPNQNTIYTVNVTNPSNGCVSSANATVNINPVPTANLTTSNSTVCANGSTVIDLTIGNTGGQATSSYTINWSTSSLTGFSVTVNPSVTTTYNVLVTSPFGCSQSDSLTIYVDPTLVGAIISISPSSTIQCQSNLSPIILVVTSNDPLVTYSWLPQSVMSTNDSILVNPLTTTTYTVSATNQIGCVSSASATVTIDQNPIAAFTYTNDLTNTVVFNTTTAGSTYFWTFGDNETSTLQNPTHIYALSGTYTVTLIVTTSSGCSDTLVQSVEVSNVNVDEITGNREILVYPNPTRGLLTVKLNVQEKESRITVMNLVGDIVYEKCFFSSHVEEIIDLSELSKGVYLLQVTNNSDKQFMQRIIKQ